MSGNIVLAAPEGAETHKISTWTANWIETYIPEMASCLYLVDSLKYLEASLERPLKAGTPPALIILDHRLDPENMPALGNRIRDCIPECWTIELPESNAELSLHPDSFLVNRPVDEQEWVEILNHVLQNARSPQWSRAEG